MDAMGFTGVDNTCSINHKCSDDLEESNSVNRGRILIRRFKLMAGTGVGFLASCGWQYTNQEDSAGRG